MEFRRKKFARRGEERGSQGLLLFFFQRDKATWNNENFSCVGSTSGKKENTQYFPCTFLGALFFLGGKGHFLKIEF